MKKNIEKIHYILLSLALLTISSCEKYLDIEPSKNSSVVVSKTSDLDLLLNNYSQFSTETGNFRLYGTDDFEINKAFYDVAPAALTIQAYQSATWDVQYTPEMSETGWTAEYRKIFTANLVLSSLEKVTGTEEEKARLKAEAHFIRAYSYWVLANTFCLPYTEANKNELGLPLKLTTSFEEDIARVTLQNVYEQIDSDIQEALKINSPLIQNGVVRNWRGNIAGVYAFAARYYLFRGNYTEAEKFASLSLNAYNVLVDYNTEMSLALTYPVVIDAGTPNQQTYNVSLPQTVQGNPSTGLTWKEFTYFRMQTNNLIAPMSVDLANQYDKNNDLRYYYHNVEGYSFILNGTIKPSYNQPSWVFFGYNNIPSGPTVAEALLTKAEALARLGRISEAMTTVNILRAKRIKPGSTVNLSAADRQDAVTKILQERRREMPFANRWFDLKRLNNNEDTFDDKVITKQFYDYDNVKIYTDRPLKTYTLDVKSRRYAAPIPRTDIVAGNNVILQNTY